MRKEFSQYILDLQDTICKKLESIDGKVTFHEDNWKREQGGGGKTRVLQNGAIFEKAGVNTSQVFGELPEPIKKSFGVEEGHFFACGISLVIHPHNPMIPTVHANFRYFELYEYENGPVKDCWFGGGADLTPYYLFEEDATHFHSVWKKVCDEANPTFYPKFKEHCDKYFYNSHRNEGRGIGGIFYDYMRANDEMSLQEIFDFATNAGNHFLEAYVPIVERRMKLSYTEEQKYFQEIRRGRYVEFNLIHDRGTLFGLKSNGRIESIFMSLPPQVRWDYDFQIKPNSPEERLIDVLQHPKEWV